MARELGSSLGLEHELRLGLQRGEFTVHYQPEVDLTSGAIVGVEALVRWTSPTRGAGASLARFIPIAEATGLILPLGRVRAARGVPADGRLAPAGLLPTGSSRGSTSRPGSSPAAASPRSSATALEAAGLAPDRLGLEVTETAIVAEGAAERARPSRAPAAPRPGRPARVDDFGTGFSSLGQLRHFPVDVIKVDRSFVQGVGTDAKDAAITANVVSLAHALGLLAIAEGIESDEQLAVDAEARTATSHRATSSPAPHRLPRSKACWPAASR